MKKALAKQTRRFLSGIMAVFMFVTSFGTSLIEPLYASAEDQDATITVTFVDKAGNTQTDIDGISRPYNGTYDGQVYLVAWLTSVYYDVTPLACAVQRLGTYSTGSGFFTQYHYTNPQDLTFTEFDKCNADFTLIEGEQAGKIRYNPDQYVLHYALYNYTSTWNTQTNSYERLTTAEEVMKKGTSNFRGYKVDNENNTVTLTKQEANDYRVRIRIYDENGDLTTTLDGSSQSGDPLVYVVSWLTDEDSNIVGWNYHTVNSKDDYTVSSEVITFSDYSADMNNAESADRVVYDPDFYTANYRVVIGKDGNSDPKTYNDFRGEYPSVNDEFTGYAHSISTESDVNVFTLTKQDNFFDLRIEFDKPTTLTTTDRYYALVEVQHSSGTPTYYYTPLVYDKQTERVTYSVQTDAAEHNWLNKDGTPASSRFNGGEKSVKLYLVKALTDDATLADFADANAEKCIVYSGTTLVHGFNFAATGLYKEETEGTNDVHFYVTGRFAELYEEYSYQTILDEGIFYGFVADRYKKINHTETNLVVNKFEDNGNTSPDLTGDYGGDFYIADFGKFPHFSKMGDPDDFKSDPNGSINIAGGICEQGATLYADKAERLYKDSDPKVAFVQMDGADISKNVVEPVIDNMDAVSAELASHGQNIGVELSNDDKTLTVDTRLAPDKATIFVDADPYLTQLATTGGGGEGLVLKIKQGQTVVFNFKSAEKVTLAKYGIEIYDENGDPIPERAYGDGTTEPLSSNNANNHNQNTWLDQVSRHVVWNLSSAKTVYIKSSAGIFLMPREDSQTDVSTTSTGWLVSDGFVENTAGEWHFVYMGVPGTTSKLTVVKNDESGNLQDGVLFEVRDEDGNLVRKWTTVSNAPSANGVTNPYTFALAAPGTYTLTELSAEKSADGGTEYNVIEGSVEINVKVTDTNLPMKSEIEIDTTGDNFKATNKKGYYTFESGVLTAHNTVKTDEKEAVVEIIKKDLSGKAITSAYEFTITDDSGSTYTINNSTTSKKLGAGTYTVTETSAPKGYEAISDPFTFTVNNDGTVAYDNPAAAGTAVTAGFVASNAADNDGTVILTITAYDEIIHKELTFSKTDLDGTTELSGAKVRIYDKDNENKLTGDERADGQYLIEFWTSNGQNRNVDYEFVYGKTYVYEETSAPAGYTIADKVYFQINEEGKLVTSADGQTFTEADDQNKVVLKDAPIKLTIQKTDLSDKPITNGTAIFRINREDGSPAIEIIEVTSRGASFTGDENLVPGTYTLVEVEAPEGYDKANDVIFKITEDGKITDKNGEAFENNTIIVKDTKLTTVTISKQDINKSNEIKGAKLEVYTDEQCTKKASYIDASGAESTETWTSDGVNDWVITLKDGTYYLKETGDADDTFTDTATGKKYNIVTSVFEFTVKDGKVQNRDKLTDSNNGSSVELSADTANKIVVTDTDYVEPTADITISKKAVNGEEELVGAKLTLTTENGSIIDGDKEAADSASWTSGADAKVLKVTDGTYTLTETSTTYDRERTPYFVDSNGNKYYIVESQYRFDVVDGKVRGVTKVGDKAEKNGSTVTSSGNVITVSDGEYVELTTEINIDKRAVTDNAELPGAKLTLTAKGDAKIIDETGTAAREVTEFSWTSGEEAVTIKVTDGTFVLKETSDTKDREDNYYFVQGGKKYAIVESEYEFTVENGKIVNREKLTDNNGSTVELSAAAGNTIVVSDADYTELTTDVTVSKKDITGTNNVKGAKISIYKVYNSVTGEKTLAQRYDADNDKWVDAVWEITDGTDWTIALEDGVYFLVEEGEGRFTDETTGITYTILPSEVGFTVADGKVTIGGETSTAQNPNSGESYVFLKDNKLTVCDAEYIPDSAKFTLAKVLDPTSDRVLPGAKFVITRVDGDDTVKGTTVDYDSTRGAKEISLPNGTYTIEETDAPDGFQKLEGKLTFTITNGVIALTDSALTNPDNESGYYVLTGDSEITLKAIDKPVKTYSVTISKKAVTGESELVGASLTVTTTDGKIKVGDTEKTEYSWDSKATAEELTVTDGTYVLTEKASGTDSDNVKYVEIDGKKYNVIESAYEFVVENGEVKSVTKLDNNVTEKNGTKVEKSGNTITISDGEYTEPAPKTAKVIISKKDITGENEVKGAVLKLESKDGTFSKTWKSGEDGESEKTFTLNPGEYTLTETGDEENDGKIVYEGKEYKVITSKFTFTVDEDGKITDINGENDSAKTTKDDDNKDGYFLYDDETEGELTVKVCDAEDKKTGGDDDQPGDDKPGEDNPGDNTPGGNDTPGDNNPGGNDDDGRKSGGSDDDEKPNDDKKSGGDDDNTDDGKKTGGDDDGTDDGRKSGGDDDGPVTGAGAGFASFLLMGAAAVVLTKKKKD